MMRELTIKKIYISGNMYSCYRTNVLKMTIRSTRYKLKLYIDSICVRKWLVNGTNIFKKYAMYVTKVGDIYS